MASKVKLKPSHQSLVARGLTVKPPAVKKKVTRKKKAANSLDRPVDELLDRQLSFENGLDRCASLLAAMLETPSDGHIEKPDRKKTDRKKTFPNRRVISSTPVDNVDGRSMELITAISQMIDTGQVSDANTIDELIEEKELLQQYLNKIVHRSTAIEKQVQRANQDGLSDIDQNSDVTRDNDKAAVNNNTMNQLNPSVNSVRKLDKSSDRTPMKNMTRDDGEIVTSVVMDKTLTNKNVNGNNGSTTGDKNNAGKSEGDKSELLEILESITSKLRVDDDDCTGGDKSDKCEKGIGDAIKNSNKVMQYGGSRTSQDEVNVSIDLVNNSDENTSDEVQSFSRDKTLTNSDVCQPLLGDQDVLSGECGGPTSAVELQNEGDGSSCMAARSGCSNDRYDKLFKEYRDNLPSCLLVSLGKSPVESCNNSQYNSVLSDAAPVIDNPKLQMEGVGQVKPSGADTSNISLCQEQASTQLTMLGSLIKELRSKLIAGTKEQWSNESDQLFAEIELVFGSLPYLVNGAFTEQADINSIVHPLQVENEDLKIKSFHLSKRVEDLNRTVGELWKSDSRSEDASVDLIIKTVQNKLGSEQRLKDEMNTELRDLQRANEEFKNENDSLVRSKNEMSLKLQEIQKQNEELKKENGSLVHLINQKELAVLEEREKYLKEASSKNHEIALLQTHVSELQFQKQAGEKERSILDATLRQRDYEIDRLSKLNIDLQESVSKLVADISYVKKRPTHLRSRDVCPPTKGEAAALPASTENKKHALSSNSYSSTFRMHDDENSVERECGNDKLSTIVDHAGSSLKNRISSLSETDFSLLSLGTFDGAEFQRNIDHLDAEIQRIQSSMKRSSNE